MKRRTIHSQSGQAIIEYILVLVVVIGILLGVAYQFNSAFRNYVMNFFGNYVACLLETGEMPTLGAQAGNAVCDQFFQPFDANSGSPGPLGAGGGGNGGPGARRGDVAGDGKGGRSGGSGSDSPDGSGGGSGADSGGYGSRPGTAASLVNRRGRPPQTPVGEVAEESSEGPKSLEVSKGRPRPVATLNPESGRVGRMSLDRRFFAERELEQGGKEKPITTRVSPESEGAALRPKVMTYEAKRAIAKEREDREEEFGFGKLLRWLLIIAIVVSLVLLIGGQALQIVKSGEK